MTYLRVSHREVQHRMLLRAIPESQPIKGDNMRPAAMPTFSGYRTETGMRTSVQEMEKYSTPDNITFERGEVSHNRGMMLDYLAGHRQDWRPHWPRRLHEAREMLSLMAPDEGRVNQDAEF